MLLISGDCSPEPWGLPSSSSYRTFQCWIKRCSCSFFSLRWLSHEQAASAPLCLTCCCLSLQVPAGSPPEVTPTALLLLLRCPWAILCEARWRRSRGLGSDCGLRPGETAHQLLVLLLLSLSVLTQALWIWRPEWQWGFAIQLPRALWEA